MNKNLLLVVEIIALIGATLYTWSTIMAYYRVKRVFTCKKCGKLNTTIGKKCSSCGKEMVQWIARYVTFVRVIKDCKNKQGLADYRKTKRYVLIDIIILSVCTVAVAWALTLNIVSRF